MVGCSVEVTVAPYMDVHRDLLSAVVTRIPVRNPAISADREVGREV
jgi:hypothetical protein